MIKMLSVLVVLALAGLTFALPSSTVPEVDPAVATELPPVAICPIEQGSGRDTTVSVVSTVDGPVRFSTFSGGGFQGTIGFETGSSGSASVNVVDVSAVGVGGGLFEFPVVTSAASSIVTDGTGVSASLCHSTPTTSAVLAGATTSGGSRFEVQLMNPYAGEAIVDLDVMSDSGVESNNRLDGIVVPPRSSATVDMTEILPGREWLVVGINATQGRVLGVGRADNGPDRAVWNAVEPAQDWYLTVPAGGDERSAVVATSSTVDVAYQVDVYGPDGVVEGAQSGQVPGGGQTVLDLSGTADEAFAVRVVGSGPLAVFLVADTDQQVAVTEGVRMQAPVWLLPGAGSVGEASGSIVLLNPGLEDVTLSLTALRQSSTAREEVVPAGGVMQVATEVAAADGYLVRGDGPLVTMWTMRSGDSLAYSIGVPVEDG